MVREAAGSESPLEFVPYDVAYPEGFEDMHRRKPDVRKLERLTGIRLPTPLETIVRDVVEDQRTRLAARPAIAAVAAPGAPA